MAVAMSKKPGKVNPEAEAETWFKARNGSVFPKKKKLVKKMMLDSLVKFFISLFSFSESSQSSQTEMPNVKYC
ncbi:hypothetical protein COLO4_07456 [Corchorus olitorius]|uniref:Uncharacterized protein n=1 Tax=Corchorus olitorius TaxID=93759 RepID=A0A1R3KJN7_9ROSI|nr:hypothetical protein COLO4_07456 [Corchorus olitorius]